MHLTYVSLKLKKTLIVFHVISDSALAGAIHHFPSEVLACAAGGLLNTHWHRVGKTSESPKM